MLHVVHALLKELGRAVVLVLVHYRIDMPGGPANEEGVGIEGRTHVGVVRAHLLVDQPEPPALELGKEVSPDPAREVVSEAAPAVLLPHQGPRILIELRIIAAPDCGALGWAKPSILFRHGYRKTIARGCAKI